LAKNEIRVQYSGFVIFAAKMLSVATGLLFQLMIARSTTTHEYGIWFNISDVTAYFTILAGVFPFWALRFTARNKQGAIKTGFAANLTIATTAALVYLLLTPLITSTLDISQKYIFLYLLASTQIIEVYILNALESCLQAKTPQTLGYGLLLGEICKITLGYILIIRFQLSLFGALISIITGVAVQLTYYSKLLAEELKEKVKWTYVKEWAKGSLANIYYVIGNQIAAFIFIMLFTYGGEASRGNYGAAAQIANIVTYSSFLAFALYPKLLAEKSSQDITTSLKTVLMFAIPMTAGILAIPDSYLTILKGEFMEAWPILVVLAIDSLIAATSTTFSFVLYGFERLDEKAKISFRELVKSRLFIAFSLPYIHSAITLPATFYVLTNYTQNQPVPSALAVAIINSTARFAMFLILYTMVRRMTEIKIPWRNIAKYLFASAVMATVVYTIPHPTRIYLTLSVTALGGIIYLALLMAIDKETRTLAHSVWQEIKIKFKGVPA
jgi:O-antigen/teichoic acid export membrane protein